MVYHHQAKDLMFHHSECNDTNYLKGVILLQPVFPVELCPNLQHWAQNYTDLCWEYSSNVTFRAICNLALNSFTKLNFSDSYSNMFTTSLYPMHLGNVYQIRESHSDSTPLQLVAHFSNVCQSSGQNSKLSFIGTLPMDTLSLVYTHSIPKGISMIAYILISFSSHLCLFFIIIYCVFTHYKSKVSQAWKCNSLSDFVLAIYVIFNSFTKNLYPNSLEVCW